MSEQDDRLGNEPPRLEVVDDDGRYHISSEVGIISLLRINDAEQGELVLDYGANEASSQQALKASKVDMSHSWIR